VAVTTMGFTLRAILGANTVDVLRDALGVDRHCPTGKTPFTTKTAADRALRLINPTERTTMKRYRCDYCSQYHIGHPRGTVY
jgi:hypothetical protein